MAFEWSTSAAGVMKDGVASAIPDDSFVAVGSGARPLHGVSSGTLNCTSKLLSKYQDINNNHHEFYAHLQYCISMQSLLQLLQEEDFRRVFLQGEVWSVY